GVANSLFLLPNFCSEHNFIELEDVMAFVDIIFLRKNCCRSASPDGDGGSVKDVQLNIWGSEARRPWAACVFSLTLIGVFVCVGLCCVRLCVFLVCVCGFCVCVWRLLFCKLFSGVCLHYDSSIR